MLVDINLRFDGFWGSVGKCHMRFCQFSEDKPLVIVCSQYRNYSGTSVTNAFETIVETAFYHVANRKIENVQFDFELPIFDVWHDDTNRFDKALAYLFPRKYVERFKSKKLDIQKIFQRIVWIEHYPENFGLGSSDRMFRIVKMNDSGRYENGGQPTNAWLIEKTGYTSDDLLIGAGDLDLHRLEGRPRQSYNSAEALQQLPGYQVIRWTEEIVQHLPAALERTLGATGGGNSGDLQEGEVHREITQILTTKLPARRLFQNNFDFSRLIGLSVVTREKNVDFAIFKPNGKDVDSILEVKRTSSKTRSLKKDVCKDIARLLMLSRYLKCTCYLLVWGNIKSINEQLGSCDGYLSFEDHPSFQDRHFVVSSLKNDSEYRALLDSFHIIKGATRLQGFKNYGPNRVLLWQVTADMEKLENNRPYKCNIEPLEGE
jgi:hypothetical protein